MNQALAPMALEVDIVSDVVCPWCIIGYKQLEKALTQLPGEFETTLRWHPFELNPRMPEEGQDLREHLAQKYGTSVEQSRAAREQLTTLGDSLGFHFDYFEGMRMVNTFRAHQLLHWAGEQGKQTELKLALFADFFSHRKDVNAMEVLATAADRVGLCKDTAHDILTDGRYATAVRNEEQAWLEQEIYAVPTFRFNGKYQVPGAQDAQTFARILEKLKANASA